MSYNYAIGSLLHLLGRLRLDWTDEYRMQDGIAYAFTAAGWDMEVEREVVLSATERIDFIARGVGIECKVNGSASAVARQVIGYLQHPRVGGLILVTARARLGRGLPSEIIVAGEPKGLYVVETWRGSL